MKYVITVNCYNAERGTSAKHYLKCNTVSVFNPRLSKAHTFPTLAAAKYINDSFGIDGNVEGVTDKALFEAD